MRRILFPLLLLFSLNVWADNVSDAYKAVVNVITYDAGGATLRSGYGFYLSEDGTGIASYRVFEGAAKADVIDAKGKKFEVERILGANSTYDLVKFRIASPKKIQPLSLAENGVSAQTDLSLIRYTTKKKEAVMPTKVVSAEEYSGYSYYDISAPNEDVYAGCPLLNENGQVVAIVQKNVSEKAANACAIDARFIGTLKITSTGVLNSDLKGIGIQKALPEIETEALTYIYMMGRNDSVSVATAIGDFIKSYPTNIDIYIEAGSFYAQRNNIQKAEQYFKEALDKCAEAGMKSKEAEVRNALSKLVYAKAVNSADPEAGEWNISRALSEAVMACEADTAMLYRIQRGDCQLAAKDYRGAYNSYMEVCNSWLSDPSTYLAAARALELDGSDSIRVLALLDSAVIRCPKPYSSTSARYLLERAQRRVKARLFREAVFDYNEYEKAIGPNNLNSRFYYLREQAELQAKMYQQALDDIRTAAVRDPQEPFYKLEEAYILLRVGFYEEAIIVAESILPQYSDSPACHKILGIAYGELGQKENAAAHLLKAREFGDADVETYLQKYK